jgi:2-oxoglutarate ferredoxin oxidoreductase subunit gamma
MKNKETCEIRLSGTGGQGLIFSGITLAEAAAIFDGKNAVQTQSYGPEARGGASRSDVIISRGEIDYFLVHQPDILLAMSQEACDRYFRDAQKGGLIILDSTWVKKTPPTTCEIYSLPLTKTALDLTGKAIVANILGLGVLVSLTGVVSRGALEKAISKNVAPQNLEMNLRALQEGFRLGPAAKPLSTRTGGTYV